MIRNGRCRCRHRDRERQQVIRIAQDLIGQRGNRRPGQGCGGTPVRTSPIPSRMRTVTATWTSCAMIHNGAGIQMIAKTLDALNFGVLNQNGLPTPLLGRTFRSVSDHGGWPKPDCQPPRLTSNKTPYQNQQGPETIYPPVRRITFDEDLVDR